MKRTIVNILGWISIVAGVLSVLVAVLLFLNSKVDVAAIFVTPGAALLIASSNLLAYGKRKSASDKNDLSKG